MSTPNLNQTTKLDNDTLKLSSFDVVTINQQGKEISRIPERALGLREDLGNSVVLEMIAIPEGNFLMGSPENEIERYSREGRLHRVTLKSFCIGKYPITQAQWFAVAALPPVNCELKPSPSLFKGDNRPVEQVSWYDALEFGDRLSRLTGKSYRLPSESEWEYSCRGGTTTAFHFGETITPSLANYNGNYAYNTGPLGSSCKTTTEVGSFQVANGFGLSDMHGNVYEWCADRWHKDYQGAPVDGSVWKEVDESSSVPPSWVIRGGAWNVPPKYCRSAFRSHLPAEGRFRNIGFRIALTI